MKNEYVKIFFVGLKKELLFQREVQYEEALYFASEHNISYIELSVFDDDE